MRKKMFGILGVATFVMAIAINISINLHSGAISDLTLVNIEALAKNETDPPLYVVCLDDENSVCVYQSHVVLGAYYSPH